MKFFQLIFLAALVLAILPVRAKMPEDTLGREQLEDTFEGFLHRDHDNFYIERHSQFYLISPLNNEVARNLDLLESGDFVNVVGAVNEQSRQISTHTINFVSLKKIWGTWKTNKWEVFHFVNHRYLETILPMTRRWRPATGYHRQFSYRLAPINNNGTWSIFMFDGGPVELGLLQIQGEKLRVTIFEKNGQDEVHYELTRIPLAIEMLSIAD